MFERIKSSFHDMWYNTPLMRAELVFHQKEYLKSGAIMEMVVWRVPRSKDKPHGYKYSLVYVAGGKRVVGFDNAEGKGDHRHAMEKEYPYKYESLEKLFVDFMSAVKHLEEKA